MPIFFCLSIKNIEKILRFRFQNQLYEFNCLPFGLNTAPLVFTKLLRSVAKYLRQRGCKVVIYLDDILIVGRDFNECYRWVKMTKKALLSLGFVINKEKSILTPTQEIEYLGYKFNSNRMTLGLPKEKK